MGPHGDRPRTTLSQAAAAPLALPASLDSLTAPRPAPGEGLDLVALLHEAARRNPDIARARADWQAASHRVPQAGALADPVLGLALEEQPFEGGLTGMRSISLSQELPFPGKRSLATEAAQRTAEAAREEAREVARRALADVKSAYLELYLLESSLWTMRESRAALLDMIQVSRSRYETGTATQQDLLLAEVERSELDGEIAHTAALVDATRARLNLLAGRGAGEPLGRPWLGGPSPFTATLDELMAAAPQARPRLRAREREAEAAEATLRAARVASRPDFMVGAGYTQLPGQPDMWRAELGVTLPVWKGRKQDAAAAEAAGRMQAARAQVQADANAIGAQIQEQYAHVSSEREIVELYRREILPMAELAYASARAGYLTGQGSFLVVLEAFRKRVSLRRAYYEYLADAEMHLAELEVAVGRDLGGIEMPVDAALDAAPQQEDER